MIRISELKLPLAHSDADLTQAILGKLHIAAADLSATHIHKRSFDARNADILQVYIVDVTLANDAQEAAILARFPDHPHIRPTPDMAYKLVAQAPAQMTERPVVVGFGPCGIFAALVLAQMGFKPIVLERGKSVRERTQDTWGLWRKNNFNPESNVQFGEGGAGTFSDGKLYSQIKDPRHLGRKVMQELVKAGAPADILFEAHPHIGTFKLVKVVENLRAQIIALGGDIRFQQRLVDMHIEDDPKHGRSLQAITVLDVAKNQSYQLPVQHVVLALGHSARDTFETLHARGVYIEAKPFSIGFRIEHPQSVIDKARWGKHAGNPILGAADYKLVHHANNGRAVYSFCMCPGGTVVAATSEVGRVVTNGMSQYSRNERNANAGIVVGITPADFPTDVQEHEFAPGHATTHAASKNESISPYPLAGMVLQRRLESHAYSLGGSNYQAPGQLVGDFLQDKASSSLGLVMPSYQPGVTLVNLSTALPSYAIDAIREALPAFGKKIKGFDMADAMLTGVETRTSSPIKITRGNDYQSLNTKGLYPAGEGASYAGGILSAAVDGIKVAEAVGMGCRGKFNPY